MKNRIIVKRVNDKLYFYLKSKQGIQFLFTQRYTKAVYEYFRKGGVAEKELYSHKWRTNRRLDKTVEKLPLYIDYVLRECA